MIRDKGNNEAIEFDRELNHSLDMTNGKKNKLTAPFLKYSNYVITRLCVSHCSVRKPVYFDVYQCIVQYCNILDVDHSSTSIHVAKFSVRAVRSCACYGVIITLPIWVTENAISGEILFIKLEYKYVNI